MKFRFKILRLSFVPSCHFWPVNIRGARKIRKVRFMSPWRLMELARLKAHMAADTGVCKPPLGNLTSCKIKLKAGLRIGSSSFSDVSYLFAVTRDLIFQHVNASYQCFFLVGDSNVNFGWGCTQVTTHHIFPACNAHANPPIWVLFYTNLIKLSSARSVSRYKRT